MKILLGLVLGAWLAFATSARASAPHWWRLASPNHAQTFVNGMEQNRVWRQWGPDRHLALLLDYTNDPFVDRFHPREYDNFRFDFPQVTLGKDGRTFYYQTTKGRQVPVAGKSPDFFGVDEVHLLPNARLVIEKPHGYLTLFIEVEAPE